jgi:hypothetical protein
MPEIISREAAKALGVKIFLSRKPCKNGHFERYTCCGSCVECVKFRRKNIAEKVGKAKTVGAVLSEDQVKAIMK